MTSTAKGRNRRRRSILTLLFAIMSSNVLSPVYARNNSNTSASTSWFHRIHPSSADGSWLWGWMGADNVVSVVDRSPPVSFVSRPASFGRMIEDVVNGYGIPMNAFTVSCSEDRKISRRLEEGPNLGCPRLCPSGGHMPEPSEAWIAIVQRGNCSFVSKVSTLFAYSHHL